MIRESNIGEVLLDDWLGQHPRATEIDSFTHSVPDQDRLYLTGGAVRDFCLGRDSGSIVDLDFVYMGSRDEFNNSHTSRYRRAISPFGSYTVLVAEDTFADIAFPDSFELPTESPVDELLEKREHNVNGMAVRYSDRTVHDPSGGQEGVAKRELRINEQAWDWLPAHAAGMQLDRLFFFLERFPDFSVENWGLIDELLETGILDFKTKTDTRQNMVRLAKFNRHRNTEKTKNRSY